MWKKNYYHEEGLIGEPYFEADFSKVFYLTDTGRCWDGFRVTVRDKIPLHQGLRKDGYIIQRTTFLKPSAGEVFLPKS